MADAVNDTCLSDSQSDANLRLESETGSSIGAGLVRLERDLKSLQSAAAAFSDNGRILINQINAIKTNTDARPSDRWGSPLRNAASRLDEISDFLTCALLASFSIEDQGYSDGLAAVLGHISAEMHKLSKELISGAQADA